MAQSEEIHRLVGDIEDLTSTEFVARMMGLLWQQPLAERQAALAELLAHANEQVREAAAELLIFMRHEQLSKDLDYVRQNSPLRPGMRVELFGGYDYYSSDGKPRWLNGRDCYRAEFLGFASCGEDTIPVGLVEFDEPVELPGHKGRYGILRTSYSSHGFAWGETEDTVEVHLTEALPEDFAAIRSDLTADSAAETHATYRVEAAP